LILASAFFFEKSLTPNPSPENEKQEHFRERGANVFD